MSIFTEAKRFVIDQVAKPVVRRLGTGLGVWLAAQEVDAQTVDHIVVGLTLFGGVAIDLVQSWAVRKGYI